CRGEGRLAPRGGPQPGSRLRTARPAGGRGGGLLGGGRARAHRSARVRGVGDRRLEAGGPGERGGTSRRGEGAVRREGAADLVLGARAGRRGRRGFRNRGAGGGAGRPGLSPERRVT